MKLKYTSAALAAFITIGTAHAATVFNVIDLDGYVSGKNATTDLVGGVVTENDTVGLGSSTATVATIVTGDFNGDVVDDTVSFTLQLVSSGSGIVQNGVGFGEQDGNNDLSDSETLTVTVIGLSFAAGGGGTDMTLAFNGFTNLYIDRLSTGETVKVNTVGVPGVAGENVDYSIPTLATTLLVDAAGTSTSRFENIDLKFTATVVPEPSSAALLGLAGLALILRRRK